MTELGTTISIKKDSREMLVKSEITFPIILENATNTAIMYPLMEHLLTLIIKLLKINGMTRIISF